MATDTDPMVVKYEALKELYAATEQDVNALTSQLDVVRDRVSKVRAENEYLLTQLCAYTASDFESDQSDLEPDDELLEKKLPLPRLDKPPTAAAKSAARRRAEKSAAAAAARKRRLDASSRKAKSG